MDPIQININIGLQEGTSQVLKEIALAAIYGFVSRAAANEGKPEAAKKPTEKAVETSKAESEQVAPAKAEKPAEAKAEAAVIDDQTLLDLVKRVKDAKVPAQTIKAVFKDLGIANSTACPQDKRAKLVELLTNLLPIDGEDDDLPF